MVFLHGRVMTQLILFDIDGTILAPGTLARELINEVVTEVAGRSPDLQIDQVAGFTDPVIVREALKTVQFKRSHLNQTVEKILGIYLARLKTEYPRYEKPHLSDDAIELVKRCKQEKWHVGLLSGNLRAAAKIKLERFLIWKEFEFGVFGDDAACRDDLIPRASEEALQTLKKTFTHDQMVLVGDTANDARVANLHGVRSLIVLRHPEWRQKIKDQNPTMLVDSFNDIETIMDWLRQGWLIGE